VWREIKSGNRKKLPSDVLVLVNQSPKTTGREKKEGSTYTSPLPELSDTRPRAYIISDQYRFMRLTRRRAIVRNRRKNLTSLSGSNGFGESWPARFRNAHGPPVHGRRMEVTDRRNRVLTKVSRRGGLACLLHLSGTQPQARIADAS